MPQYLAQRFDLDPNKHIVLIAEEWESFSVFFTQSQKECSSETEKTLLDCSPCLALLSLSLFLARSKHKNVALSGQMKGNQANMSERPCLFVVYLWARPGFCGSRGLYGLLSCRELLLNRQRVSQPASCQASTSSLLLFVFECSCAEKLPPSVFPFPTEFSNLFLQQESCLTAAYRSWNEKSVTKASVPFTAIV